MDILSMGFDDGVKQSQSVEPKDNKESMLTWLQTNKTKLTGKDENGDTVPNGSEKHNTEHVDKSVHGESGRKTLEACHYMNSKTGKPIKEINMWSLKDDGTCSIVLKCRNMKLYAHNKGDDPSNYKKAELYLPITTVDDMVKKIDELMSGISGLSDLSQLKMCYVKDDKVIPLTN